MLIVYLELAYSTIPVLDIILQPLVQPLQILKLLLLLLVLSKSQTKSILQHILHLFILLILVLLNKIVDPTIFLCQMTLEPPQWLVVSL